MFSILAILFALGTVGASMGTNANSRMTVDNFTAKYYTMIQEAFEENYEEHHDERNFKNSFNLPGRKDMTFYLNEERFICVKDETGNIINTKFQADCPNLGKAKDYFASNSTDSTIILMENKENKCSIRQYRFGKLLASYSTDYKIDELSVPHFPYEISTNRSLLIHINGPVWGVYYEETGRFEIISDDVIKYRIYTDNRSEKFAYINSEHKEFVCNYTESSKSSYTGNMLYMWQPNTELKFKKTSLIKNVQNNLLAGKIGEKENEALAQHAISFENRYVSDETHDIHLRWWYAESKRLFPDEYSTWVIGTQDRVINTQDSYINNGDEKIEFQFIRQYRFGEEVSTYYIKHSDIDSIERCAIISTFSDYISELSDVSAILSIEDLESYYSKNKILVYDTKGSIYCVDSNGCHVVCNNVVEYATDYYEDNRCMLYWIDWSGNVYKTDWTNSLESKLVGNNALGLYKTKSGYGFIVKEEDKQVNLFLDGYSICDMGNISVNDNSGNTSNDVNVDTNDNAVSLLDTSLHNSGLLPIERELTFKKPQENLALGIRGEKEQEYLDRHYNDYLNRKISDNDIHLGFTYAASNRIYPDRFSTWIIHETLDEIRAENGTSPSVATEFDNDLWIAQYQFGKLLDNFYFKVESEINATECAIISTFSNYPSELYKQGDEVSLKNYSTVDYHSQHKLLICNKNGSMYRVDHTGLTFLCNDVVSYKVIYSENEYSTLYWKDANDHAYKLDWINNNNSIPIQIADYNNL